MIANNGHQLLQLGQTCRRFRALVTSARCFICGIPLFFSKRPGTPLRVLCVIAFDTLHTFRNSDRLTTDSLRTLATLLDFAACVNAVQDHKKCRPEEYECTLQQLEAAGSGDLVQEYLQQLGELERNRPFPGGDLQRFQDSRAYREAVVRLSLAAVATVASDKFCLNDAKAAVHLDEDLDTLFRIIMLCQIIDDVMDYSADRAARLPSFLTSVASFPQSIEYTRLAAKSYASARALPALNGIFPLQLALVAVSALAELIICLRVLLNRVA